MDIGNLQVVLSWTSTRWKGLRGVPLTQPAFEAMAASRALLTSAPPPLASLLRTASADTVRALISPRQLAATLREGPLREEAMQRARHQFRAAIFRVFALQPASLASSSSLSDSRLWARVGQSDEALFIPLIKRHLRSDALRKFAFLQFITGSYR